MAPIIMDDFKVPSPKREKQRIQTLRDAVILDSNAEEIYDRYSNMAARVLKAPIALVSLVDTERQWFKSRVGLSVTETPRELAFCAYAIMEDAPPVFVVPNALKDPRFSNNPLVLGFPSIRFYAGASLEVDGERVGTLCVIDTKAKDDDKFGEKEMGILKDLANIVADLIAQRRKENLTNIYRTLHLNGEMLKLLKIPLNHLQESQRKIGSLLEQMKRQHQQQTEEETPEIIEKKSNDSEMIECLVEEVQVFSKEVNRLLPISTLFTRLLVEVYRLEPYDCLANSSPFSFLSHHQLHHSALTEMNVERMQSSLESFSQISYDPSLQSLGSHPSAPFRAKHGRSCVTVKWMSDVHRVSNSHVRSREEKDIQNRDPACVTEEDKDEDALRLYPLASATPHNQHRDLQSDQMRLQSPHSLYSYPTFMQLIVMLLYDVFDYNSHHAVITIQLQQAEKLLEDSLIREGKWKITVQDKDKAQSNPNQHDHEYGHGEGIVLHHKDLSSLFTLVSKFVHCSHKCYGEDDQLTKLLRCPCCFEMMIPAYVFSSSDACNNNPLKKDEDKENHDGINRKPSPTASVGLCDQNQNKEREEQEEEEKLLPDERKRKPSFTPDFSSFSSSVVISPYHFIKSQWKQYVKVKNNKVHHSNNPEVQ